MRHSIAQDGAHFAGRPLTQIQIDKKTQKFCGIFPQLFSTSQSFVHFQAKLSQKFKKKEHEEIQIIHYLMLERLSKITDV